MPFGVVSGVGRRMGVLDEGLYPPKGREGIGVFLPINLNGVFERIFQTNVFDSCVNS